MSEREEMEVISLQELADKLWSGMLDILGEEMNDSAKTPLHEWKRPRNFLGSQEKYKERFDKAVKRVVQQLGAG